MQEIQAPRSPKVGFVHGKGDLSQRSFPKSSCNSLGTRGSKPSSPRVTQPADLDAGHQMRLEALPRHSVTSTWPQDLIQDPNQDVDPTRLFSRLKLKRSAERSSMHLATNCEVPIVQFSSQPQQKTRHQMT